MIATFQALGVALLALLPGASFIFAYERRSGGSYGAGLADRLIRFLAISAVFAAVASGPLLLLYRTFIANGRLRRGDIPWVWFEIIFLAWVLLPFCLGWLSARLQDKNKWLRHLLRVAPHKRAWDYVWERPLPSIIRLKLKSGTWLAGLFHGGWADDPDKNKLKSWAAGYPEKEDLWLSAMLEVNPATGLLLRDASGRVQRIAGLGVLVRWEEVEYLIREEYSQ